MTAAELREFHPLFRYELRTVLASLALPESLFDRFGVYQPATYAATKAFVTALSEAMHAELEPSGVHVTVLCPGFTRTEFQDRADYDTSKLPDFVWQTAEEVAEAGLRGVAANRTVVVPGAKNKLGAGVINVLPGSLRRFALDKLPR